MKILKTTTDDKKTIYQMTKGATIQRMQDATGKDLVISDYVHYVDEKDDGSSVDILSILTEEGEIYATNSKTVTNSFFEIEEIAGNIKGETIEIVSGTTKAGRTYYDCCWK